ncbi:MAG: SprT family zinc-dependent metalloprotease [Patescibacteria group bacterium]|jgi:hypothetical protein
MQKQISLQNKNVTYTLRKSLRARRMRLAVYCDGAIVVTTPYDLHENIVEKFIREKSRWLLSKLDFFQKSRNHPVARYTHGDYLKYRDSAYSLAVARVNYFNKYYNCKFNSINIRNQKTRWGSCSKKGNLNFNYKIALLPTRVADYIIVHELCHLQEFNHSGRFWRLVAETFPDYKEIRRQIR